ncbi:Trm112 family protein [Ferrimonas balearica]|uniref:Trm112 family protein n=1 Tax=Ferrimonas balearica TaxID=44012 RepID=UPI001C9A08A6|nr:Trm112 family protein [Ferrimonas balearica]MBY5993877.1 Trm112 family protein [Ferrimonas balearica]
MSFDNKLLEIIACPVCKGKLEYDREGDRLICKADRLVYPITEGIPVLLEDRAEPYRDEA